MGNLKTDLINELIMRKNYLEQDLVRYGEVPNIMPYKEVVEKMLNTLKELAEVDTQMSYIPKYFREVQIPQENDLAPNTQSTEQ